MIIREMNISDIQKVRNIAFDTWRDTYSSFIPEAIQDKVLGEAYSDEAMDERFKSSIKLVAENNDEILGYAFFYSKDSGKNVFLESLYVHPKHQRKSAGKHLFHNGLERFRESETISLTVYKGNPSISFYKKEGFAIEKELNGDFFDYPIVFTLMKKNV